jgi:hypothetical protein
MANVNDLYQKGFGQMGSIFADGDADLKPPTNRVFIAITFLADSTLDASGGLVGDTANDAVEFVGTDVAAHNATAGNATTVSGEQGVAIDASNVFPAGVTIFGRWTEIDLDAGMLIAYIGE